MTIHWNAVEQCFTAVLFIFQFNPSGNFEIGTVRGERVKQL